jgi:hypothetical protein
MGVERKVRGERAFPRPAFSGRKRKDMHTPPECCPGWSRSVLPLPRSSHPGGANVRVSGEYRVYVKVTYLS